MYSQRELLADRIVNFGGAALSWVGAPAIAYASWSAGDSLEKQAGLWAFGFGLVVLMTCSAFFHLLAWRWNISQQLLSLDHIGISSMIMGCYIPVMQQVGALRTLAVVLALGVLGWIMEAVKVFGLRSQLGGKSGFSAGRLHVVRYLCMGWACLLVLGDMRQDLPTGLVVLIFGGGLCYSAGVVFFVRHSLEFHQAIWHAAVVLASACFYFGNFLFLVGLPLPVEAEALRLSTNRP